jgi:hypothetical protein
MKKAILILIFLMLLVQQSFALVNTSWLGLKFYTHMDPGLIAGLRVSDNDQIEFSYQHKGLYIDLSSYSIAYRKQVYSDKYLRTTTNIGVLTMPVAGQSNLLCPVLSFEIESYFGNISQSIVIGIPELIGISLRYYL